MTRSSTRRLALVLAAILVVIALFWFGLADLLTLDELKERRAELAAAVADRPAPIASAYFGLYVLLVALSVPGAAIMTLAGGAIFGLLPGLLLVSFASTAGATLAMLASRYLLRDWVERRFGARLGAVNRGIERDGALYLLVLRLNPIIPFFLVNLGMGLTRMSALRFALVSQIGMLPATFVYVNAGTQLARIEEPGDIASPALIGSLLLLSLFPLIGKWAAGRLRRRRVYRGWKRPRRFDRNLIVIGGGAAGLVTAYIAAATRAKVTLIEGGRMGGDCLNTGCVPSKALIRSARAAHEIRGADAFGMTASEPQVDFPAVMRRVREIIAAIEPADSAERYRGLGVDVRLGRARLVDPWTVEVEGERISGRAIVVATGSEPIVPPLPGLESVRHLTSETLWDRLSERGLPGRLVILGGGPIGVELAQAFARLGSRVALVEAQPRLLAREAAEASTFAAELLAGEGVEVRLGQEAVRCDGQVLVVRDGRTETSLPFDELLIAVGRRPRLSGFGLEALGIAGDDPPANRWLETRFPHIYLAGDVEGTWQFTHAAAHQAWHAAINGLFGSFRRFRVAEDVMPRVTFTDPEIAAVGAGEEELRAAGTPYRTVTHPLDHHDRALTEGTASGFVKLLVSPKGQILGATIVGHNAGEMIAIAALAMRHRIGLAKLLGTVLPYPTMAEGLKLAAGAWRRETAPERLLGWAGRFHRWRRR